ncbi:ribonuclease H-like domain-containing protein [Tanacetum coccineum]
MDDSPWLPPSMNFSPGVQGIMVSMIFLGLSCNPGFCSTDIENEVDISALTMEQYIALIPDDIKPGIVNPKIGDDVEFEINTNFMRELRRKLFAGTDGKDAYEYVRTENKANGRNEKRIVAIEDSNSKALVATDNNEDIDWTKEFDAEPVTYAMMALTGVEQDDWSIEFDAEHMHFGQDGLGDFDWSNKADDAPVSLALMATNSEVPYCSKCSKSYKKLLESYQTERDNFQRARTEILGYQMSLESLEVMLKTHEKNEYAWGDKYEQMEYDLKIRDLKLEEKQKELDQVLKERDDFKVKLEKWTNASVLQNEVLNKQRYLSDKSCIGFGVESSSGMESDNSSGDETLTDHLYENFKREKAYKAVPPPTGTIIPPRANVSFTGIDELAIRNKVNNQEKIKSSQPEIDRNKVIIEDWVDSDDEETVLNSSETQKKTVLNSENSETSFKNRSPSSQNSVGQGSRKKGLGNNGGKLCFVCYSPNHLIKDCNLHERNFKQTQTHKPKRMQGSRDTRPVWNNINRVNHSNFSGNSRYPHQKRSFIPSAVLTREGLKSTARPKYCNCSFSLRPKMTQTVPSKRTANVFYQGTARPRVPQAVLSRSTGRPYYPRMDNRRPSISSYSPSSRSSTTRTPYRTQRPKKIVKSIWVKKGSTVESQAVLPQNVSIKRSAMITSKQTWRQNRGYLDSVNRDNGSYILKQFEYGNPEEDLKDYAIIDSGCSGTTFKGRIACKVWTLKEDLMLFLRGDMENEVDISALTMEQYIALIPDDIKPGIVNPKIDDDVEFEINANFMRELRRKLFVGTYGEDAYEHVRTVLEIVDVFHFPSVTHNAIMLRVFPITLKGRALRWKDRFPTGSITKWDLLKKEFIWSYCHPFMTAKKSEEIRNFKQERDETLFYAWERYNDLLYQCPLHDLNCQQKVHIFYIGLDISTHKILDSNGFVPLMTPTQALESIQVMADHSHNWYDETTTRERINYFLDNVDTIHKSFKVGTSNQGTADNERMRKILENLESNIKALKTRKKNLQEKAYQLTHKVLTNTEEKVKAIMTMGKENIKEPVLQDLPPMSFLGHLKEQMGSPYKTRETVPMNENPKEIHNAKAQDDEGDMDIGWDITSKDVERLRQSLTPTTHTLPSHESVGTIYTTGTSP